VTQYAFVDDCLLAHICDAGFSDAARENNFPGNSDRARREKVRYSLKPAIGEKVSGLSVPLRPTDR
jgi:hypothetical protein